jgi:hypothetical protein
MSRGKSVDDLHTVRDAVIDAKNRLYRSWTVDELLCHPSEATKLVQAVRKDLGKRLDECDVCKTLMNARKQGKVK